MANTNTPQYVNFPYTGDGHTSSGAAWGSKGLDCLQIAHATYNFAIDGGAVGAITPVETTTIPQGAILWGGVIKASSTFTSGGSATIAVGTTAGSSATSILGATPVASWTSGTLFTSGTETSPVSMTVAGKINVTIGTAALTAGQAEIWVAFIVSPT